MTSFPFARVCMPMLITSLLPTRSPSLCTILLVAAMGVTASGSHAQMMEGRSLSSTKQVPTASSTTNSRPTWGELTGSQREALAPLAPHWAGLTENHKRKWIAMSRNFADWPADEQARLHDRMSAWAGLSPGQRDQARMNFAEARKVAPDEKKARWEAYQALSENERDRLATAVAPKRPGVAAPARLAKPAAEVKPTSIAADPRGMPRSGLTTSTVDHNTLLPQHTVAP